MGQGILNRVFHVATPFALLCTVSLPASFPLLLPVPLLWPHTQVSQGRATEERGGGGGSGSGSIKHIHGMVWAVELGEVEDTTQHTHTHPSIHAGSPFLVPFGDTYPSPVASVFLSVLPHSTPLRSHWEEAAADRSRAFLAFSTSVALWLLPVANLRWCCASGNGQKCPAPITTAFIGSAVNHTPLYQPSFSWWQQQQYGSWACLAIFTGTVAASDHILPCHVMVVLGEQELRWWWEWLERPGSKTHRFTLSTAFLDLLYNSLGYSSPPHPSHGPQCFHIPEKQQPYLRELYNRLVSQMQEVKNGTSAYRDCTPYQLAVSVDDDLVPRALLTSSRASTLLRRSSGQMGLWSHSMKWAILKELRVYHEPCFLVTREAYAKSLRLFGHLSFF